MDAYLGLFFSAFLAATLVPAYSEIMFAGLAASGYDPLALWAWASAGNTLGSVVNWALGRYLLHFQDRRWFPFRRDNLEMAQRWFRKFGVWSLLLAWMPVGGDALGGDEVSAGGQLGQRAVELPATGGPVRAAQLGGHVAPAPPHRHLGHGPAVE